jgi:uncharacterized RDD family membrane protein YckC
VIVARPAGFWIRVVAAIVDFAVFWLVNLTLGLLAARVFRVDLDDAIGLRGSLAASSMLFVALYVIVLHALEGQTIGKLVTRVRVVGADDLPPPIGASVLRFFAYFVSLLPFGLGFLMAGLRADRRALHDLIAGTRVERLPHAVPPAAARTVPLEPAPPA